MATAAKVYKATTPSWRLALKKWAFSVSYFNQLGLMYDDVLRDTPVVQEALRRLPDNIKNDRQFRITRALYLSMRKEVLPKDEWTKFEDDVRYLRPIIEEIEKENHEKLEWKKL